MGNGQIDLVPDYITVSEPGGKPTNVEVVQIWIDPDYPEAHRDPALREYLMKLGERGCAALIRYNEMDAFTLFPPTMMQDRQWHEARNAMHEKAHSAADKAAALGGHLHMKVSL
jgi:hypothetical protein